MWREYADGTNGKITVVKLGLTADTPDVLHGYRRADRQFPYHSTVNQFFRAPRFDAYVDLGRASTTQAIERFECLA